MVKKTINIKIEECEFCKKKRRFHKIQNIRDIEENSNTGFWEITPGYKKCEQHKYKKKILKNGIQ